MSPNEQLKLDAIVEGIKEFARVVLIAAVSAALTAGLAFASGVHDPYVGLFLTSVLTAAGKAWDKKVHADQTTARQGIVPF